MIFHSFLSKVLSPSYVPQGSSLQSPQHGVSGAQLGAGRFSARFQIKRSRWVQSQAYVSRFHYSLSGKRHRYFLKILRKNGSVTGVHSDHPSF